MLNINASISEIIQRRFSCRTYRKAPISAFKQEQIFAFIEALPAGPFGAHPRFDLAAATDTDSKSLRGLGTYGFIKDPPAFILGAMRPSNNDLEDFGYLMEAIILHVTSLDLGTCWLGGTFTKSSFARKMNLSASESIPAAISLGGFTDKEQKREGWASQTAGSHRRLPWEKLFFNYAIDNLLARHDAAEYAAVLDMVQVGPSASNKQPWRIIKDNQYWRFYLQRTPGYYDDPIKRILGLCDLQRLDMGIAMCHFELTAKELGLQGHWVVEEIVDKYPAVQTEYIVSWESQDE